MRLGLYKYVVCLGFIAGFNLRINTCEPAIKLGLNTGLDLSKIVVLKPGIKSNRQQLSPLLISFGCGVSGLRSLKKNKEKCVADLTLMELARVSGFYELPRFSQDLQIEYPVCDENLLVRKKTAKKRVRNL